jgi:hypothetical protein
MPLESAAWNATQSGVTMNSAGYAPVLFILIVLIAIFGFALLISSLMVYTKFMEYLEKAIHSVRYTIYGIGMSGVGLLLYGVFELLRTATRGFDPIWYLYGIIAYAGFTIIGWVVEKAYVQAKKMNAAYAESKKEKITEGT